MPTGRFVDGLGSGVAGGRRGAGGAVTSGCGLLDPGGEPSAQTAPPAAAVEESLPPDAYEEATPSPETPEPTTPAPKRSSKKPKPQPAKTEDPNNFTEPDCADHEGRNVSKKAAKAALNAAAAKTYWPGSAPALKVPADLVRATAWHESGWQSNIVNCDGGRGLMQVMPATADFVNARFEKSYDAHDYRQNAILGANYLAWLTRYFGDLYFAKNYSLSPGRCSSTRSSRCLLNLVIAGYNAGPAEVEAGYAKKRLPRPEYVDSVRSLMRSCFCDRY
jgi:soluble lytic murein transglycosylase-like protein